MIKSKKDKMITNIKKSKWILDKVFKMVDEWHYCMNITQQVNAIIWLLRNVNSMLLENHLNTCAIDKFKKWTPKDIEKFISELINIWDVGTRK